MREFCKRHKRLTFTFWICIWLLLKNSEIPYLFNPPWIIAFLFDAPNQEFFKAMVPLVDIFTSAYVTGLIFYLFVEFIPTIENEEKAKVILEGQLQNLYFYISELLARIDFSAKRAGIFPTENPNDLNLIPMNNEDIYCKVQSFIDGDAQGEAIPFKYNLLDDCNLYKNMILELSRNVAGTPSLSYCDLEIINIISEIQLATLFTKIPKPTDFIIKFDNVSYEGFGEAYEQMKKIHEKLGALIEKKHGCEMQEISEKEIDEWNQDSIDSIKANPEIIDVLLELAKQNRAK